MTASRIAQRVVYPRGPAWRCGAMREALARRSLCGADAYAIVREFADLWKDHAKLADQTLESMDAARTIHCQVDREVVDLLLCDLLWRAQGLAVDSGELRPKLELLARKFESVAEILAAAHAAVDPGVEQAA